MTTYSFYGVNRHHCSPKHYHEFTDESVEFGTYQDALAHAYALADSWKQGVEFHESEYCGRPESSVVYPD